MSKDYFISVRKISRGKFTNEPGKSRFLVVPTRSKEILPEHEIGRKDWADEVIEKSKSDTPDQAGFISGDILVFIHGYNTPQEIAMKRHRKLSEGLTKQGFKGVLVTFDWPSASSPLNYLEDRSDAEAVRYFV